MPVHVPMTVAGLPELAGFSAEERRRVLRAANCPSPLRLWTYNASRGIALSSVSLILVHLLELDRRMAGLGGATIVVAAAVACTFGFHALSMIRIRGQLRMAIEEASAGGRSPICLSCGHDCAEIQGDRCPECGASLLVPAGDRRS